MPPGEQAAVRAGDGAAWGDPGFFVPGSRARNALRLLVQLVRPPRSHRIRPTRTGSMLILITIGVGTAAFNTGQNILYLALSLLLSTLLVSGILSWVNFSGCRWRLEAGRHFRAGEPSPVYVEALNTKRRLPSHALTFILSAGRGGARHAAPLGQRLDPGARARLQWDFTPRQRGREAIVLEGVVSRYPFGFLKKTIRDSFAREVVVWPARIVYQFSGDKAGRRWMYGRHRRRGEGVDLVQLRPYRSGDPLRRIHWKASARMGALQVRETEQEHHQAFSLWIEPSARLWRDARQFEAMCSFAASLAEDLYQRDQLRAACVAGHPPVPVGGIGDLHAFLDQLGELERGEPHAPAGRAVPPAGAVRFVPGPGNSVIARIGEVTVGQA